MNREVIATGRTVDEALDKAYEQLGISRDEAQFEILDLPKKGFLVWALLLLRFGYLSRFPKPSARWIICRVFFTRWGWIKYRLT